ncbi:MAG: SOS response-associated peptidase [Rhodothermaceae bacterium]|nr:SOS response-associated peptidase [Rhodothermaceae bacterium]MXZ58584.1 SOS response-associated peptidase [Rhodothermaceae bacterium]MYB89962.1 SOS response-associated peptidase [Rhodothermaceae bacterium]MYD67733.1 SOS response-associated peptidase [Rhodothermaceae bacterium]MYG43703.1 SOS response-associated peptidase [Rhodothermaceae bacterium]
MCGRIAQSFDVERVSEFLEIQQGAESIVWAEPSYNIAPGSRIYALQLNENKNKAWITFRWGMLPTWAKMKRPVINARAETVTQKPMFRNAFRTRRSVIPVTAYYEWRAVSDGKQPYCIRSKNGFPLLLAGLYTENECVILTRSAQRDISFIHDRMPVVVNHDMMDTYLNQPDVACEIIGQEDLLDLEVYPVTKKIGNPALDHPVCLKPLDRA